MEENVVVSYEEFEPDDTTGLGQKQDLLYRFSDNEFKKDVIEILIEPHHTEIDIENAKDELIAEYGKVRFENFKLLK